VTIRVVVVDDQELVRSGFRMILNAEPDIEVVGEAADGTQALFTCRAARPDVVLMDIRMPGMDGVQATQQLTSDTRSPPIRVLILTTFDLDEYVFGALRAGASGFLLKDTPPDQLTAAVRTIAGGDALLAPAITRRLIAEYVAVALPTTPPELDELTRKELEVLRLMATGMSNAEIASTLVIGETTVKTHVTRVLMKLRVRDRVQAVVLAYEAGVTGPRLARNPTPGAHPRS